MTWQYSELSTVSWSSIKRSIESSTMIIFENANYMIIIMQTSILKIINFKRK